MKYGETPNWPPHWRPRKAGEHIFGEIGTLTDVIPVEAGETEPAQLFLYMKHDGVDYVGSVLCKDVTFCRQLGAILKKYRGHKLQEVGGLDLSRLL